MTVAGFIQSLIADGRVRVSKAVERDGSLVQPTPTELNEAWSILCEFESEYRIELPGSPPPLSRDSALWAALTVYRASGFLAHRDASVEAIQSALSDACPESPSPAVCYSADLTLRFLPDLIRLAKAVSSDDPLVGVLIDLARGWPLSSVGIAELGQLDASAFLDNDCLRGIYIDRIIATNDRSRLNDPRTREAILAAVGIHHQLASELLASNE